MMKSIQVNISLPAELKEQAQHLATERQYRSLDGFVAQLLKRETERDARGKRLEEMLDKGYNAPVMEWSEGDLMEKLEKLAKQPPKHQQ